jgi:hypothetical protein
MSGAGFPFCSAARLSTIAMMQLLMASKLKGESQSVFRSAARRRSVTSASWEHARRAGD